MRSIEYFFEICRTMKSGIHENLVKETILRGKNNRWIIK